MEVMLQLPGATATSSSKAKQQNSSSIAAQSMCMVAWSDHETGLHGSSSSLSRASQLPPQLA